VVRPRRTYRARGRPPTHLLDRPHRAALRVTEAAPAHGFTPGHDTAPVPGVIPEGAHIHHWRLGLKQSSLGHIARVLRHPALNASRRPPRSWHALVPFGFPVQVSQATQEHASEFLPTASGIRRSASRRTPCMRFSRTRLTGVLHRRCSAGRCQGRLGRGAAAVPLRLIRPSWRGASQATSLQPQARQHLWRVATNSDSLPKHRPGILPKARAGFPQRTYRPSRAGRLRPRSKSRCGSRPGW
jgi:hypothetical protein